MKLNHMIQMRQLSHTEIASVAIGRIVFRFRQSHEAVFRPTGGQLPD